MKVCSVLVIASILFLVTSCRKSPGDVYPDTPAESTNDLVVTQDFSWQTADQITLQLEGLSTPLPYQSTLTVETLDGVVCLQVNYKLADNLTAMFSVPAKTSQVTIKYGNFIKTIPITDNLVFHSFIPVEE